MPGVESPERERERSVACNLARSGSAFYFKSETLTDADIEHSAVVTLYQRMHEFCFTEGWVQVLALSAWRPGEG